MRWTLFAGLGERLSRLRRRTRPASSRDGRDEIAPEFTTEELAEFLEADLDPIDARPEFREQLRDDLWAMVQDLYGKEDRAGRRK